MENLIIYQLDIYPPLAFETQYVKNAPAIYNNIVVMTFLATSGIFLLYDLAVKYKHNSKTVTFSNESEIFEVNFPLAY